MGLRFRAVAADTGAIGGSLSHEFQVIADTGEDLIVYNPNSQYAANIELAEAVSLLSTRETATQQLTLTPTPDQAKCDDVAKYLKLPLTQTLKSMVMYAEPAEDDNKPGQVYLVVLRADHELNEVKLGKLDVFKHGFRMASDSEIIHHFGCPPGYLGPINMTVPVLVIADKTAANMSDFVCGANKVDHHYTGANWGRDLPEPNLVVDLRNVVEGDPAPDGQGQLAIQRGIEVGHVFYLGTRYSEALNATFLDENGKPKIMEMGCYGIGITRILGAAIEQNHDDKGIIWPKSIAPFEIVICPIGWNKSPEVKATALELYEQLSAQGIDVVLDDRDERPGSMFADWELVGVPLRVTVGERTLKEGFIELQTRRDGTLQKIATSHMLTEITSAYQNLI